MSKNGNGHLENYSERCAQIRDKLRGLGFVGVGSLRARLLECGKATCHCHDDPANRHGPCHHWTRKAQGRSVAVLVSKEDAVLYRQWITRNVHWAGWRARCVTVGSSPETPGREKAPMIAVLRLNRMGVTAHCSEDRNVTSHQPLKWAGNRAHDARKVS
jgi:hypothetical protein